MKWFRNMKIRVKLLVGFVLVALIGGLIAVVGQTSMTAMSQAQQAITDIEMPSLLALRAIQNAQARVLVGERGLINAQMMEPELRKAQYEYIDESLTDAEANYSVYAAMAHNAEESALWRRFTDEWHTWLEMHSEVVALSLEKDGLVARGMSLDSPEIQIIDEKAIAQSLLAREAYLRSSATLDDLVALNQQQVAVAASAAMAEHQSSSMNLNIAAVAGVLIAVILGTYLSNSISRPVNQLVAVADRLAQGEVDMDLKSIARDETGILTESFARMIDSTRQQAAAVEQVSRGNLGVEIKPRSEKDVLSHSLFRMVETLRAMLTETQTLTKAAVEGRLTIRGATDKFTGGYKQIIEGLNQTLDAVVEPITEASGVLEKLAQNDLTARVTSDFQGDYAKIKTSVNTAMENLSQAISQVVEAADQVGTAANQISASAQGVASGTAEQASSLEEVSSSLEEISSMTKNNADNAVQAQNLSKTATQSAEEGKHAMERMNKAIAEIKASSDETARIIKTIDEIAFQTNLLALNAAVEAARAGEAGRGFAVVAEEVRNLALRSAEAAKDTATMIEESVKRSDNGVKIAEEVDKALLEIAEGSKKVNDLVAEIAAASQEQAKGIEQVTVATGQMDKVTQQNASNAEESASAAEELSSQANQLAEMVSRFVLDRTGKRPGVAQAQVSRITQHVSRTARDKNLATAVGETRNMPASDSRKPRRLIPLDDDDGDFSDF